MDINTKLKWSKLLQKSIKNYKDSNIKDTVLIIDGLNLFIRAFSVIPTVNDDGIHNGGLYGALNSLRYAIKNLQPTRCIIIFDGKGGSVRRRKLFSEYKNNRRGMKHLNRTFKWLNEHQEEESAKMQLVRLIEYLDYLPITTFTVDNIEADDAIAYTCKSILIDNTKCIIMSSDKDYLQLVNEYINVWSPTKKKLYNIEKVKEEYEIEPQNIIYWRMIDGDPSDAIPGIQGIGRKTVLKLFKELFKNSEKNIDLDEFFEYINYLYNEKKTGNPKTLFENKEILKRNYNLMQLHEVDISGTSKSLILDNIKNKKIPVLNQTQLKSLLLKDKLYTQIRNFSSWYSTFFSLNSTAIKFNKQLTNTK